MNDAPLRQYDLAEVKGAIGLRSGESLTAYKLLIFDRVRIFYSRSQNLRNYNIPNEFSFNQ